MRKKKLYNLRLERIYDIAIDYDGYNDVKNLKDLIDEMKDIAIGKYDDDIIRLDKGIELTDEEWEKANELQKSKR